MEKLRVFEFFLGVFWGFKGALGLALGPASVMDWFGSAFEEPLQGPASRTPRSSPTKANCSGFGFRMV